MAARKLIAKFSNLAPTKCGFAILWIFLFILSLVYLRARWIPYPEVSGPDGSGTARIDLEKYTRRLTTRVLQPFEEFKSPTEIEPSSTNLGSFFVDEQFSAILNTFKNTEAYRRRTKFRSGTTPKVYIVSMKPLSSPHWVESLKHFTDGSCSFKCAFTDEKTEISSADAVLVHLSFFKFEILKSRLEKIERDPSQPWIAFSVESPTNLLLDVLELSAFNGVFNRTMTYRRDSDVIFSHGFIVSKEDAKVLPPSWVLRPHGKETLFDTRKLVVGIISHCHSSGGRMKYINELKQYIPVDLYGKCGSLQCGVSRFIASGIDVQNDTCMDLVKNYLFYLSFENSIADDYATEKLYNALYYPVVPIVFGGANYSRILPPNSYISAMDYSPEQLAKLLIELSKNETMYQEKLSWRQHYQVSTVGPRRIYCDLCTELHQPQFFEPKVYNDFFDWFFVKSHCSRYTGRGVEPIRKTRQV